MDDSLVSKEDKAKAICMGERLTTNIVVWLEN
jgi:hypothetical protein